MDQMQCVEDDIRNLVAGILELEPSQIDGEARLVQDLGMDSMMALEIIASLEKRYKIRLPEQELQEVKTLQRVIELARRYVQ